MRQKIELFSTTSKWNSQKPFLTEFSIKSGWAPISNFLGLPDIGSEFPHENKSEYVMKFLENTWRNTASVYDQKVDAELKAWMKSNGYQAKKISAN